MTKHSTMTLMLISGYLLVLPVFWALALLAFQHGWIDLKTLEPSRAWSLG